jgi:hypothetical protein
MTTTEEAHVVRDYLALSDDPRFNAFLSEFQGESDRAAAVLGAAYLDDQLKSILVASWVDESRRFADLLEPPLGPLATFSSRILVACAVGLIAKDERSDLDLVCGIRNDFAHKLHGLSFEEPRIASKCQSFSVARERLAAEPRLAEAYRDASARKLFDLAVALLAYYLTRRVAHVQRFLASQPALWARYDLGGEKRIPEVAG